MVHRYVIPLLIYAQSDEHRAYPGVYVVRHSGKQLVVTSLNLGGTLTDVLCRVSALTERVRGLAVQQ